jgi:hypothetical protein
MEAFEPRQFATLSEIARLEPQVGKWLRSVSIAQRETFLREVWAVHPCWAVRLARASQLSSEIGWSLLKEWLQAEDVNSVRSLAKTFGRILGPKTFWKCVAETELSPRMKDMLDYHRNEV